MEAVHGPEKIIPEIVASMRELMVSCFRFQPERRRHQDNPRLGLTVVSLDKVAGNANLKDLYVRVHEDGQLLYVEDFEDGKWLDLFQLREYKPARMALPRRRRMKRTRRCCREGGSTCAQWGVPSNFLASRRRK